jgi:hypothetical protein
MIGLVSHRFRLAAILLVFGLISLDNTCHASSKQTEELQALVNKLKENPNSPEAAKEIENNISSGLPARILYSLLKDLPVDMSGIERNMGYVATERSYIPVDAREPQSNTPYPRVCYIFMPTIWSDTECPSFTNESENSAATGADPDLTLFCRVHYTPAINNGLAARIGRLLLLSRYTLVSKTGHAPNNGAAPFDVWLCKDGNAGGEQWGDNIYYYDLKVKRSSIEWIREIVHEYSHLSIPGIGGYKSPEYWANGYIGERIVIRWMRSTPGCRKLVGDLWGDFSGYDSFNKILIAPAISLYKKIGPNKRWQSRSDEQGMRYLIGEILTIDDKYGSRFLGDVFNRLPRLREARPSDLTYSLSTLLSNNN